MKVKLKDVRKVIAAVRHNPILYDAQVEGHTNAKAKQRVWEDIAKELHEDCEEVKKKWKNLRDTYVKTQRGTKSRNKLSHWTWSTEMNFFKPYLGRTRKKKKPKVAVFEKSSSENEEDSLNSYREMTPVPKVELDSCMDEQDNNRHETESMTALSKPSFDPISSCSVNHFANLEFGTATSVEDQLNEIENESKNTYDDVDFLLLAYARTIKKFSAKRQATTKFKIAQLVMEQELQQLDELNNTTGSTHS